MGKELSFDDFNPDCMEQEELERWANQLTHLARYCHEKAWAMKLRYRGEIEGALRHETIAQQEYDEIDIGLRW